MSSLLEAKPLHTLLVETLDSNKGSMNDTQLFKLLKKSNRDLSERIFNKVLLRLELEGLIHVSTLTKKKRRIDLVLQKKK
ncbi:MAG: hypothetical protein JSW01_05110 [Candidatus Bathyarchaeota archaeon]|nr:MAG: hypothetical protein JSW01_05110 [Candidatus Bathyarchaeota archaeon]